MELSGWALATVVSKFLSYIGVSAAIGGPFIASFIERSIAKSITQVATTHNSLLHAIWRYCRLSIGLAIVATIANFFIQVGAFAEAGLAGMIDSTFVDILWQSSVGDSTLFRLLGLIFIGSVCGLAVNTTPRKFGQAFIYLLGVILLGRSFSQIGHSADMTVIFQLLLSLHLVIVAWWMGALWPLWRACHELSMQNLHKVMDKFGLYASIAVSILILCGGVVGYMLIGSPYELIYTSYGQGLGLKLLLVGSILLLAAYHKWQLVPALLQQQARQPLARSIVVEMLIGITILAITTVITTVVGPEHLAA